MPSKTYNAVELAREIGVDRGTVSRWAADGCPAERRQGKNRGSVWSFELPPVVVWLLDRAEAIGRASHDHSTLPQIEKRRAQVELELAELRLAELSGLVIRVDDVLEIMGADYDSIRNALRSVPARIGPDLWVKIMAGGTEADVVSNLENELDDVLSNLSGEQHYGGTGTGSTAPATNGSGRKVKAPAVNRGRAKRKAKTAAKADAKRVGRRKPVAKR